MRSRKWGRGGRTRELVGRYLRRRSFRRRRTHLAAWSPEILEPRCVLDARLVISEIVAANEQGLQDEDGDRTDWIEIYNAGDAAADLAGWRLTDDAQDRNKWMFPAITIEPEQYLVVYASGKDRRDPTSPLHASFQLNRDGEYLGLIAADGATVVSEFSPSFPALLSDRAFGLAQGNATVPLITATAAARVFVPTTDNGGDSMGLEWTDVGFDDSLWIGATNAIGFDAGTGYEEEISADIEAQMYGTNTSAYIRIPFQLDNPYAVLAMRLRMKYDDGYVAYLNGVPLDQRNAPSELTWNAEATANHRDTQAVVFEETDLSGFVELLRQGDNVLALHAMNSSPTSDDFLMSAELDVTVPTEIESGPGRFVALPTPGGPNGTTSYVGLVAPVSVSVERGFYDQAFDVTLENATPGASLVYTTDGSAPSPENGVVIPAADPTAGPSTSVHIDRTTTLRVAAVKDDYLTSTINTQTYIMLSDVLTQDFQATLAAGFPDAWGRTEPDYGMDPDVIGPNDQFDGEFANQIIDALKAAPSVSVVMDMDDLFGPEGIYVNSTRSGPDWERPTSFEFIDPNGGSVQANAGIRIQGDNVRNFANSKKQSLRFEFRGDYGPTKLRYPVFGDAAADSFDTLILRGGYNDAWVHTPTTTQYIRDQWWRTTLLEMGQPQVHGRFVHVFLNGFYWGVYNMVERPNASFSATYSGGDKDDWDALNTGVVRDGTRDAWADLLRLARDVDDQDPVNSNTAYLRLLGKEADGSRSQAFETLLDVDNYIDYLIVNFYGGNTDWPGRNYYVGRLRGPESTGFKFYAWDTEKILDHGEGSDLNTNRLNQTDGVMAPFRYLRNNEDFRLLFADHVHRHFFNEGTLYVNPDSPEWNPDQPQNNRPAERYDRLAKQIEMPLIGESARWGDTHSTSTRNDNRIFTPRDWRTMRDRLFERYFPKRSDIVLKQFVAAGLYPDLASPVFNQQGGEIAKGFQLIVNAPGDVYYTLDGSDPRQSVLDSGTAAGEMSTSAIKADGPITLNDGAIVRARTFVDGQWSALNEATFTLGVPTLRVSELMYHPRDPEIAGAFPADDYEFVELVNVSEQDPVDLTGVAFTDGIEFEFPAMSLAPGARIVVARNVNAFVQRYGADIPLAGQYGGTADDFVLSNAGETLRLEDRWGGVIQEFSYDDAWLPATDGDGYSLTIVDPAANLGQWDLASNWRASLAIDGTPGTDDTVDFNGDGALNEVDINTFCGGLRAHDQQFDLTGDGTVDQRDLDQLVSELIGTSFGDANLDGVFNSNDLVIVLQLAEYEDGIVGNSNWGEGDWNCDGDADTQDIVMAFIGGGYSAAATAVTATRTTSAELSAELVGPALRRTTQLHHRASQGPAASKTPRTQEVQRRAWRRTAGELVRCPRPCVRRSAVPMARCAALTHWPISTET